MTAHIQVPSIEPAGLPATLSPKVLTGLLRDELHFKGLVVTDALEMAGVASQFPEGEACIRAVEAGADVLLMPVNPDRCIDAIASAVRSGRLSQKRIDASANRIMAAKRSVGLYHSKTVSLDNLSEVVEDLKLSALADDVAQRAVTLIKDDKHLIPVPSTPSCLIIATEGQFSTRGETLARELHRGLPDLQVLTVNDAMSPTLLNSYAAATSTCSQIYVGAFVTVNAARGSVALQGALNGFLSELVAGPKPVALVTLGNPYLLRDFPGVSSYLATFSSTQTSELAAARALLGTASITGRLPIAIPPFCKIGDGISVAARPKVASNAAR
jgi:beta-N-acetylhexosaminidase